MSGDRRGPLVVGTLMAVMGAVIFLAAGDVIPQPDEKFGAPRWVVALCGLAFFFAGGYAVSLALPAPQMGRLLGAATGLTLLTMGAVFFTWLAVTGGEAGRSAMSVRALAWVAAVLNILIALAAWVAALRALVRWRAP